MALRQVILQHGYLECDKRRVSNMDTKMSVKGKKRRKTLRGIAKGWIGKQMMKLKVSLIQLVTLEWHY